MELIRSNSKYIYSPIDKMTNYDGLLERLNRALAGHRLHFARRATMLDAYAWHTAEPGWLPLAQATDAERAEAESLIAEARSLVSDALSGEADAAPLVEQIFSVPDPAAFINFRQGGNGIEVAMAGWGFKATGRLGGAARWIIPKAKERLHISLGFRRGGAPLPAQPFSIQAPVGMKALTTGADGLFSLPPMAEGTTKEVMCDGQSFTLTATKAQPVVWLDLPDSQPVPEPVPEPLPEPPAPEPPAPPVPDAEYTADLCAVNAAGVPQPGIALCLTRNGESTTAVTDERGCVTVTDFTDGEAFHLHLDGRPEVTADYTFSPEVPVYYLTLMAEDIRLHVVEADGRPIAGASLTYTSPGKQPLIVTTDAEGRALLPADSVTNGQPVTVTLQQDGRRFTPADFTPTDEERDYELRVVTRRKSNTLWVILAIIVFLLLALFGLYMLYVAAYHEGWWSPFRKLLYNMFN